MEAEFERITGIKPEIRTERERERERESVHGCSLGHAKGKLLGMQPGLLGTAKKPRLTEMPLLQSEADDSSAESIGYPTTAMRWTNGPSQHV